MASFKFDDREFRKAIGKVAKDSVREVAKDAQRVFDRIRRSHAGKPVEQVMPVLRSAARSADWKFTDVELRSYAEAMPDIPRNPHRRQVELARLLPPRSAPCGHVVRVPGSSASRW